MIDRATLTPVQDSKPLNPGAELASHTTNPSGPNSRSTPATSNSRLRATLRANSSISGVSGYDSPEPPRVMLALNDASCELRFMAPSTLSPTTNTLRSVPGCACMYSWTMMASSVLMPCAKSMKSVKCVFDSTLYTPLPYDPAMILTMAGQPISLSTMAAFTGCLTSMVLGVGMPCSANIWCA